MTEDTTKKIVHVKIIDGDETQIKGLLDFLKKSKKSEEYEFLVTNEKIEISDVRNLIDSLYSLYNKMRTFREERTGKSNK